MTDQIEICLSSPAVHTAAGQERGFPEIVLEGALRSGTRVGRNTLLLSPGDFEVTRIRRHREGDIGAIIDGEPFAFSADFLTSEGWRRSERAYATLSARLGRAATPGTLYPFVAIRRLGGEALVYHLLDTGTRGALYVRYGEGPADADAGSLMSANEAAWRVARNSFNDGCWYSKYRADVEIEKKLTFPHPVDTWRLNHRLYCAIVEGKLAGFIPEFNDEFQVWDFENYMFDVLSPADQRGYVSFIPQSNGRMTVKQKLFAQDQEIRVEKLKANVDVPLDQIAEHARALVGGEVRALPPYRRKRFDVNLESLETGNVFGIFFDLCRPLGDTDDALFQCEIEYLRSRTMGPIERVLEEYEQVARFSEEFLQAEGVEYKKGYYSKLSYLRDYVARRQAAAPDREAAAER
jgi:hypothetical protein